MTRIPAVPTDAVSLIYQPLQVKRLMLKNRIVMAPIVTNFAAEDGTITDRIRSYYAARAQGGVGLVAVEASYIVRGGTQYAHSVGISEDRHLPGLRSLSDAIRRGGALSSIQLWHAGRRASPGITKEDCVAPSAIAGPDPWPPRAMSHMEIDDMVIAFGRAAHRAREAGFDMVEIHMAHGYLICQFLSPNINHRSDAYGGSLENRLRFPLAVVAEVRRQVGADYPVIARISADEYVPGGLTVAETPTIAHRLQAAGVDVISVSGGAPESNEMGPTGRKKSVAKTSPGYFIHLAKAIKDTVSIPTMAAGRLADPAFAGQMVAERKADLIGVARALLADPEWANKVAAGRGEEIRGCKYCNGCLLQLRMHRPITCKQNVLLGQEHLQSPN